MCDLLVTFLGKQERKEDTMKEISEALWAITRVLEQIVTQLGYIKEILEEMRGE